MRDFDLELDDQVVMSILEKLAKISKMEVDPSDKNQSPCFQRHQILKKIEIEDDSQNVQELHQKYQNSDPSLAETTNDAADEHQLKLDALVSERDSLPNAKLLIASSAQKAFTPLGNCEYPS
ncbi:hypothetical protein TNCV_994261 [Trichonephila clavipes]|nr:hypothetical protein TNCV_994261 [Trichonephila clavipes]